MMSEPEHGKFHDQRLRQVDVRRIFDLVDPHNAIGIARHTAREITGGAGGGDFTNDIRVRLFLSMQDSIFLFFFSFNFSRAFSLFWFLASSNA
jgi:hypothetical protein